MKRKIRFFGILALLINIFFAGAILAEETKETQIIVDEVGLYQLAIEKRKSLDWRIKFPPGADKKCVENIISDYKSGNLKAGYIFECSPTETVFSMSQGGFLRIPIKEKWLMTIFEEGPKFVNIPRYEIKENKTMNIFGTIYFISILVLFVFVGYYYDYEVVDDSDKYLLPIVLGAGSLIIVIFNNLFLSEISENWIMATGFIYWIVSLVFITFLVGAQIISGRPKFDTFLRILIFVCALLISLTNLLFFGNLKSSWERSEFFVFQLLLIGLAWCFEEIVFAWRKEKLFKPKMVRASRIFHFPLNSIGEERC